MLPSPDSAPRLDATLYEIVTALRANMQIANAQGDWQPCALCRLTTRSVGRWLRVFVGEYVNDPAARETLRRARGFCALHARQLESLGDPLAVAILYSDLAGLARERWEQQGGRAGGRSGGSGLLQRLRPGAATSAAAPCPACAAQTEAQGRYVHALADGLENAEVWSALDSDAGLCVPHVEQLIIFASPAAALRLRECEIERLTALQAELEEIVRKNDHRFRGEAWGPEKDAWRRALDKLKRDAQS